MKENNDYKESRKNIRAKVHNTVVGILNFKESENIGTITDISLGGVKFAYDELKMEPEKRSLLHSIDLIANSYSMFEIPCTYIWDDEVETQFHNKLTTVKQCGIQFGKLTPKQTYLLSKFIDICISEGIKSLTSKATINV